MKHLLLIPFLAIFAYICLYDANFEKGLVKTFGGLAKYRLAEILNYSTKACGGILPNHCYKPFLFVFGLTI